MNSYPHESVPLLGALLVSEGLLTPHQLDEGLMLQAEAYQRLPLGQVLVECGFISQEDLDLVLAMQREIKSSVLNLFEAHITPPADLTALVLHLRHDQALVGLLQRVGVAAAVAPSWAELCEQHARRAVDMVLVNPNLMADEPTPADLRAPLWVLPGDEPEVARWPAWTVEALRHFVDYVRTHRRLQKEFKHLQRRELELSAVARINQIFSSARSPEEAMVELLERLTELCAAEVGLLYSLDHATGGLRVAGLSGLVVPVVDDSEGLLDGGIANWVARSGRLLFVPDLRQDPRFHALASRQHDLQIRSVMCLPLIALGKVQGVLQLINKPGGAPFTGRDLLLLRTVLGMAALGQLLASDSD